MKLTNAINNFRAGLHVVFVLLTFFFDVWRHLASLGMNSTIESNGTQMHCKVNTAAKCERIPKARSH